jgi:hypothetical protein
MNRKTFTVARAACARAYLETRDERFLAAYHDLLREMVAARRVETDIRPALLQHQAE